MDNNSKDYTFKNNFDKQMCIILGRIVLNELHKQNLSKVDLYKLINDKGYKLSKTSLYNSFDGANFGAYHFGYWMKLFSVLGYNLNAETFANDYLKASEFFTKYKQKRQIKLY